MISYNNVQSVILLGGAYLSKNYLRINNNIDGK